MDERDAGGYIVAYRRDDIAFPVIVMALMSVGFLIAAFATHTAFWILPCVASAAGSYYNIPLLETGRPVLGANQYGIFIQGLGLIRWRAIGRIDLVPIPDRSTMLNELHIALLTDPDHALVTDWRSRPVYRVLMRLPWSLDDNKVIRVSLDPFDQPPEEIHKTLVRMWRHFRS